MAMINLEKNKGAQIMARLLFAVLALSASIVAASAQEFPLTIETKFGTTVIEERPNRIATLDFNGADDLLAMGVQPVAIRHWYGDFPKTVWPWAAPLLTTEPVVLARNLDIEAIATSEPDIILAMWSGIDQRAFDQLSQIAPVVAVPDGVGDYEMPWDARALRAGRAMGMEEAAARTVADINAQFDAALAANPNWNGLTATVAFLWNGRLGVYGAADIRPQVLARMGLETSDGVNAIVDEGDFAADISNEALPEIDSDVILWFASDETFDEVRALPGKSVLRGGHVFVDNLLTGAFSHASLLSLPYVLERLPDALNEALRDPDTAVLTKP